MSYNVDLYLDYLQTPQLYEMLFLEFSIIVMPNYKDIAHHNVVKTAKNKVQQLTKGVAGDGRKLQKIDAQIAKYTKSGNLGAVKRLKHQRQGVLDAMKKKITLAKKIKFDTRKSAEVIRKQEAGRKKLNKAIAKTAKKAHAKLTGKELPPEPKAPTVAKKSVEKVSAATKTAVKKIKASVPDVAPVAKKKGDSLGTIAKKAAKTTGKIGLIAGASAAAAYGGYKIYQRYLSQAAKKCKGKSGSERSLCIKQYMQARRKD